MKFEELFEIAKNRRTAKQYNHELNISEENLLKLYEFVKTAPHSLGQEYVRVINISRSSEHKAAIVPFMKDFNQEKSFMASDVAIIVTKENSFFYEENEEIIESAGRVVKKAVEARGGTFVEGMQEALVKDILNGDHGNNNKNFEEWSARQGYIVLGYFMIGAAALGIESTASEGFTKELTTYLKEQKLIKNDERAAVCVYLGYSDGMERVHVGKGQLRKPLKDFVDFVK